MAHPLSGRAMMAHRLILTPQHFSRQRRLRPATTEGELAMRALFVTVRMKPEYRDQILKGALEDGRGSREDEPGCLRFDVIQDDSDPNTIYFYEVYRDDAALQAHRASPHYPAWGNLPAEWFVGQKAVVVRGTMIAPSEAGSR
jgi:(4S)-4-hydroxy-5-phosphonooxypentane-2,3-dione isomerase